MQPLLTITNLHPALYWTIVICSIGLGFYLFLLVVDLIFVASFRHIMKKHNKALSIIYSAKYDQLVKLHEFLIKHGATFDEKVEKTIKEIDPKHFVDQSNPECILEKDKLTYIQQEIMVKLPLFAHLNEDQEFALIKNLINEIDRNLRLYSIAYNSDVLGYNYWVRFLPWRFIFLMFKVKTKETI